MSFEALRVRPGRAVRLSEIDPTDTSTFRGGKRRAESLLPSHLEELDRLQELFYADGRRGLLVVLQGMDTAGKDGTIRHVFEGVNPQGVRVWSFKVPTPDELGHDFLWRIHQHTPLKGNIAIFNRSQYEDVLVARVHHLAPRKVLSARYAEINDFEHELTNEGVSVLKFYLHIDRDEQGRRLRERLKDPSKQWKLSPSDARERGYWSQYTEAYEEMLRRTTTPWAPWYIVPSNHKWFRNLVVSAVMVDTLRAMKPRFPPPKVDLATYHID
jgi:PPK2 family polyphosphate:nucleotide phosphotransferase